MPLFAATASGLFADHGLDVELLDGEGSTPERIASGDAELGLTATLYFLRAQAASTHELPVRFVMPFHQRDPIAGLVRDDSALTEPADLADRSVARWGLSFMTEAYVAALAQLGGRPSRIASVEGDPSAALRTGSVEVVPTWAETVPVRSYADVVVRAIPFETGGYASGLIAADTVSDAVLTRLHQALVAAFSLQRAQPHVGVAAFHAHYPHVPEADARDNWDRFVPFAFSDASEPRAVRPERWQATVANIVATHGLPVLDAERLYRIPAQAGDVVP